MRRSFYVCAVALSLLAVSACGGSGGSGGGGGAAVGADVNAPSFGGVRSVAIAGGAFVRIDWNPAEDEVSAPGAISYRVFAAATSGTQDFGAPILSTAPGTTSVVLSAATSPLIAVGADVFLVVRAVDAVGNVDANTVEIVGSPVAAAAIAFVSDTAGGAGTLGDPTDPFSTVQAGVTAVEGNGGGAVLVDAAGGGTSYAEEVNLTAAVSNIGLYGGFPRFSTLPAAPTGDVILATRAVGTNPTILVGTGLFPLTDGDLVRVTNTSSPTYIDGFHFDDLRPTLAALTGTVTFTEGRTTVDGVGTLFTGEAGSGTIIQLDGARIPVYVDSASSDTRLLLSGPYRGSTASGPASTLGAAEHCLQTVNAALQLSCCSLFDGAPLGADTTAATDASTVRLIGNYGFDPGTAAFEVGGGIRHLRVQNNDVGQRDVALTAANSATGAANVLAAGTDIWVTNNLFHDNREMGNSDDAVDITFLAADAGSGGALMVLAEYNELRNIAGEGLSLRDVGEVGLNGSATLTIRHNALNGVSASQVEIDTQGGTGAPYAGVDITIEVSDNSVTNGDSIPIDVDVGVSAMRLTTLTVRDNLIAVGESEAAEVRDENGLVLGDSDGGRFDLRFERNTMIGGVEDVEFEVGATHNGLTRLNVIENTVISSEDEGFNIDLENHVGTTGAVYPFPDGVFCLNVFNNDVAAHDDEPYEIFDQRGTTGSTSLAICYVGSGFNLNGSDPSDGALTVGFTANDSAWLVERQFGGMGGADGTEVGIELDTNTSSLRNQVRVLNSVSTLGSGGGIEWDAGCWGQLINNTSAYNGETQDTLNPEAGFEFKDDFLNGDSQAFVLNCISSHTGGQDIDFRNGVRPIYSLIRDDSVPSGIGNLLNVDPYYASDINDLVNFAQSHGEIQSLFQLLPSSPAINAGHPAAMYNDRNGSRNDMGAYGGPGGGSVGITAAGTALPLAYVGVFPAVHLYAGAFLPPDTQVLRFGFTRAVDPATLTAGISMTNGGASIPGVFSTEAEGHIVVFTPNATLGAGPIVEAAFNTALRATTGAALDYAWRERIALRPAAPAAEAEPNDDTVAGVTVADLAAAQATGVGSAAGVFELTSSVASTTDVDAYSFTATAGARIMVTTLVNRLGMADNGEIRVDLYDAAGRRLTEGHRNNYLDDTNAGTSVGDAYLDHVVETAGTYYIVVTNPTVGAAQPYGLLGVLD